MSVSVGPQTRAAGGAPATTVSVGLGTLALLVMAVQFPPDDLSDWLSRSTGLPLWMVFGFVTLACVVGLLLTRRDTGTRRGAVARYVNAIVGLLALLATVVSGWPVHGAVVWLTVLLLVIAGAASGLLLWRGRRQET